MRARKVVLLVVGALVILAAVSRLIPVLLRLGSSAAARSDLPLSSLDSDLLIAAGMGRAEDVRVLLDKGASAKIESHGLSALESAMNHMVRADDQEGAAKTIELLLDHHADPNASSSGQSILEQAARIGSLRIVNRLLDAGADPNKPGLMRMTPLSTAAGHGHPEVVATLATAGARPDEADGSGWPPLMSSIMRASQSSGAARERYLNCIRVLLAVGANPNFAAKDMSPLTVAVERGQPDIVELLLASRANVEEPLAMGNTPLGLAAMRGHLSIIQALVRAGASIDRDTGKFGSPLIQAILTGCGECSITLIQSGARVNRTGADGLTPLLAAATYGLVPVMKLLIAKGADLNAQNPDGVTPLISAANSGHTDAVRLLLSAGADLRPTAAGMTALGVARAGGRVEIAGLLLKAGAAR